MSGRRGCRQQPSGTTERERISIRKLQDVKDRKGWGGEGAEKRTERNVPYPSDLTVVGAGSASALAVALKS